MFIANLLHLSFNMWEEHDVPSDIWRKATPTLRFDRTFYDQLIVRMVQAGFNMLVLDLGDGVRYRSHPEIALPDAWTPEQLQDEARRLRDLGITLIPKLNFSACHDTWLGEWSRRVSTPAYYQTCRELIEEVIELLEPPYFHLGMDEETAEHQRRYNYVVIRQHDLLWHDLLWFIEQVDSRGVTPWIWSDLIWHHEQTFLQRVPRTVLQSNWYYHDDFSDDHPHVRPYRTLEAHGYDQMPTCSNFNCVANSAGTVAYARQHIAPERLRGFLQTPWRPTTPDWRSAHEAAIDLLSAAVRA